MIKKLFTTYHDELDLSRHVTVAFGAVEAELFELSRLEVLRYEVFDSVDVLLNGKGISTNLLCETIK